MKQQAKSRKPQQPEYIFQVETLSHEGRGIAHYGSHPDHPADKHGKKVFIRYALPGETVKAQITHEAKRLEEAEMVALLAEPSANRVEAVCPHYGICGGCSMQHIHPDEQIRLKQNVLQSHLQHFAGIQPEQWLEPIRSLQSDYRRRARIGVRYLPKQDRLILGFREHHSNRLTSIHTCSVLDKKLSDSLPELRNLLQSLKGKVHIGHVELAKGDHETSLLVRHIEKLNNADVNQLRQFALHKGWQLYLQPKGPESLRRIDEEQGAMRLHYALNAFDVNFAFSPLDFTQVNATVNEQMVQLACELLQLQQGERVLDLFCGLGNFSLPLARCVGAKGVVVGVEASEEMVQRATDNAKRNNLVQASFFSQDLTKRFFASFLGKSRI